MGGREGQNKKVSGERKKEDILKEQRNERESEEKNRDTKLTREWRSTTTTTTPFFLLPREREREGKRTRELFSLERFFRLYFLWTNSVPDEFRGKE